MFHHTHSYLATELYNAEEPLLMIGSILPDIALTGVISWDQGLHGIENDNKFSEYMEQKYPDYIDLAKGVHAHNIIDDFTHLDYKGKIGYAYQNNTELTQLIARFYELDEEKAKVIAHNYIESGVDILLIKDQPEVQTKLRMAINQIDRNKLAEILSSYFHKNIAMMLEKLNLFLDLYTKYDFSEQTEWYMFWVDIEKLLKLKNIGEGKREQLLNKALQITKGNYKDFLEYTTRAGQPKI